MLNRQDGYAVIGCASRLCGEISCGDCGLDPICRVLEYGEADSGVPEGVLLRRRPVARGETIFAWRDPFHSFFAVKSGSFKAMLPSEGRPGRVIGFQFAGELMGIEGMAGRVYPYTARALENSSVCELRLDRLPESGKPLETLQQSIIEMLGQAVAFNQEMIASLVHQSADQRIAGFLLGISDRLKRRGLEGDFFMLSMSRGDIASYLGLASETVSRILTKMSKSGCIRLQHRRLRLIDTDALRRIAYS